jgi:hypothetical protein
MNEPTGPSKDYEAMTRQELRKDLEQYDFVTPTGEPLAPLLDTLMKENLDPKTVANTCQDIEAMKFECRGGPLPNSAAWIELRRRVGAPGRAGIAW